MADDKATHNSATTLAARLAIALAQGLLIYALIKARADTPVFGLDEAIWRRVLETLRLFAIFAPLPLLFGMGNLPPARLAIWSVLAAVAVFFFGWFAAPSAWSGGPAARAAHPTMPAGGYQTVCDTVMAGQSFPARRGVR